MRYTEPKIIRTDETICAIQHVGSSDINKPVEFQEDTGVSPTQYTDAAAYEADE